VHLLYDVENDEIVIFGSYFCSNEHVGSSFILLSGPEVLFKTCIAIKFVDDDDDDDDDDFLSRVQIY